MTARSLLFVPGNRNDLLSRALDRGADAVIVDLEDAVSPSEKTAARDNVAEWLSGLPAQVPTDVWVRINHGEAGRDDLEAIGDHLITGVMAPKVTSSHEVATIVEAVRDHHSDASVFALVETAAAALRVNEIASVEGVSRLMLGDADLGAELGISPDSPAWESIRVSLVVASAAYGLEGPAAGVFLEFRDLEGLEVDTRHWESLGYRGRAAIHPAQIVPINRIFAPSSKELEAALDLLATARAADGAVSVSDCGEMIDEAVLRRARSTVARAENAGIQVEGPS